MRRRRPADRHRCRLPIAYHGEVAGSTGDDRPTPAREDVRNRRVGQLDESRCVELLLGLGHVEQVVPGARAFLCGRLRRPGIEAAVALLRVGRDDLRVEPLGQLDRERGLPRCGRADDDQ